jgi:hypothetical protein
MQKKNNGNSNISPCQNVIFKTKIPLKEIKFLLQVIKVIHKVRQRWHSGTPLFSHIGYEISKKRKKKVL